MNAVLAEREKGGAFTSFPEFCSRMYDHDLNKRVLDSLIRSGSFDSMGYRRSQLLKVFEQVVDSIARDRKQNLEGQFDLFGGGGDAVSVPEMELPNIPEFSPGELMSMEKEITGLYLSGHPMDEFREQVRRKQAVSIATVLADNQENGTHRYGDGVRVTLAGVIASVKTKTTKNNSMMAYVTLEDASGTMELLAFSRTLSESGAYLKANLPVAVTGRISIRDEKAPQLMVDKVEPLQRGTEPMKQAPKPKQTLWIKLQTVGPEFGWLSKLLDMFPGKETAIVYIADKKKKLQTGCVIHEALLAELTEVLGAENVVLK